MKFRSCAIKILYEQRDILRRDNLYAVIGLHVRLVSSVTV